VRASAGDALAWITDGKFKVVARNDDASADTYDAHLVTTLPASGTTAGTYYVIFRDYDLATHYFNLAFERTAGGGDAAWRARAETEIGQMVLDFTPLGRHTIAKSGLPAAGQARFDASAAVLEVPTAYKLAVAGKLLYLVLATGGSGFGWSLDLADPTMCRCEHGAGQPATCTWMDGSTAPTTEIACE
jgi:hypothetical protein